MKIPENAELPSGYGFCYYSPTDRMVVVYRWPLNHIVALCRTLWFLARDARGTEWQNQLGTEYRKGHREGYAWGLVCGEHHAKMRIRKAVESGDTAALAAELREVTT